MLADVHVIDRIVEGRMFACACAVTRYYNYNTILFVTVAVTYWITG